MTSSESTLGGSFRDPSGFLFTRAGVLYRQVNQWGREDYELFLSSGLYAALVEKKLLIPHQEVDVPAAQPSIAYKIIQPERVPFISYPYEWSFSQLKNAARATLRLQQMALEAGMSLKDSSAYNIQFFHNRATLIDSLSFEKYQPGQPWAAYRQFCQHFLAPLALMTYRDARLTGMLRAHLDGLPLDLVSRLLPVRSYLNPGILIHLHLHARSMRKYSTKAVSQEAVSGKMSKTSLQGLVDSLRSTITRLEWKAGGTAWADYYDQTNYTPAAFEAKKRIVTGYLSHTQAHTAWDLGANTGVFSRLAAAAGMQVIAFDLDAAAVEGNYRACLQEKETRILPLVMDLANPSPALGWQHAERSSLLERGPADLVMALALIHHLVIGNNLPFHKAAQFFRACGEWLIIEFIPKTDSQIQKMLAMRKDIFDEYDQEHFEAVFGDYFRIIEAQPVTDSERIIYLMQVK